MNTLTTSKKPQNFYREGGRSGVVFRSDFPNKSSRPPALPVKFFSEHSARTSGLIASVALLAGCASGSPLLHPAAPLPKGQVRGVAGFSSTFAVGSAAKAISEARAHPSVAGVAVDPQFSRGALVSAALAPGVAPFFAARVGAGRGFEGGLAYTGRGARIDVRKAWSIDDISISAGVGGSALFYGASLGGEPLPRVDLSSLRGYGFDVPLLVGWESAAGAYSAWGGARIGFEHAQIAAVTSEQKSPPLSTGPAPLSADRAYAGGVGGVAIGLGPIHAAMEVSVSYQSIVGRYDGVRGFVGGISVMPAGALWWRF